MTAGSEALSVLVADDHWLARRALAHVLEDFGRMLRLVEAADGSEAIERSKTRGPFDLIIIDLNMPGGEPFERIAEIRKNAPTAPVCVLSVSDTREDVMRSLRAGAVGYIPKSAGPDEIRRTIERVLAGDVALPQRLLSEENAAPRPAARPIGRADAGVEDLTPRQRDVFFMLGDGLSNAEIAERLTLSSNTVRVHIQAIAQRLNVRSRTEVVLLAAQHAERV
ncbi:MAG: response regulator transcription factor [Pseudomonadota bacterium]